MTLFGGRHFVHVPTKPDHDIEHIVKWDKEDDEDDAWKALMSKVPKSRSEEQVKAALAAFPLTLDGTNALRGSFFKRDSADHSDEWLQWLWSEPDLCDKTCAFLRLGCLVWHQLQYNGELTVEFDHC